MAETQLTFHGGAGTVTGANFLLNTGDANILIDCGLEQGSFEAHERNREPFPYEPSSISVLIITHAHLDHIGRIPQLVRAGFTGPIYSTGPTKELAALMFDDALGIMRYEQQEKGIEPLYDEKDVEQTLSQWQTHEYHDSFSIGSDIEVEFFDAGHILGSAIVVLERKEKRIAFTGDLGNTPAPILRETEIPEGISYMLMESVYGDRVHEERDQRRDILKSEVARVHETGGVLLIPAFSIQRTQLLLYELNTMVESGALPETSVFLDSPLAIQVTEVYRKYPEYFNEHVQNQLKVDEDVFVFPGLTITPTVADSQAIADAPNPKVVIAGSGMSHGGRIRAHEKRYLNDGNATILFVGYQTPGSLGRRIQDGEKRVKIDDDWVGVKARTATLSGYSAHKDRDHLIDFVEGVAQKSELEQVFVAMGEPRASQFLAQRLHDFLGIDAHVPEQGEIRRLSW